MSRNWGKEVESLTRGTEMGERWGPKHVFPHYTARVSEDQGTAQIVSEFLNERLVARSMHTETEGDDNITGPIWWVVTGIILVVA